MPVFVVTHEPPTDWFHPDAAFTFVLDGVASAVEQANIVAGDKTVAIASADIARQFTQEQNTRALAIYAAAGYHPDGSVRESQFRGAHLREVRLVVALDD